MSRVYSKILSCLSFLSLVHLKMNVEPRSLTFSGVERSPLSPRPSCYLCVCLSSKTYCIQHDQVFHWAVKHRLRNMEVLGSNLVWLAGFFQSSCAYVTPGCFVFLGYWVILQDASLRRERYFFKPKGRFCYYSTLANELSFSSQQNESISSRLVCGVGPWANNQWPL